MALAVGDGVLRGIELQPYLLSHVAGAVQPINGSISRGVSGSKSSTHSFVRAVPDCIAVWAGL